MKQTLIKAAVAVTALACVAPSFNAQAQDLAAFYANKEISFIVGSDPGGSFDPYARALANHMPRHIPGSPKIIVRFGGGQGGGIQSAIQLHNTASRDGLTMGMLQQTIVLNQVLQPQFAKYDAREWFWLGNMAAIRNMLALWHTSPAQTIEEAKKVEVIIGATGKASPTFIVPDTMNRFLGTKFKMVMGYKGAADLNLAMQRGEIQGRGASWLSVQLALPQEIKDGRIKPIVFASITRDPSAPNVPTLAELMTNPLHKRAAEFLSAESDYGRSVLLPPGVPADRAKMMRAAFEATMKDPDFLAEAQKLRIDIDPISGDMLAQITRQIIETPAEVLDLVK
jgi:tripartite-type tricarboxylate transporter receptor subunit TctC